MNINNFESSQGCTEIRDPRVTYNESHSTADSDKARGFKLSLACQSGTDMMHVIGNVTAVVLQYIVDQFPSGTFKTVMPSTRLAHAQLRHTPKQLHQQPYPMCIVNPRASLSGLDARLSAGSFATSNWSMTNRFQNRSEMENLLFDKNREIEWLGKINRIVMQFDFVLSFRSLAEQQNWASYLINKIPTDSNKPFDIDAALELAIPDGFLAETSRYCGIPIKDDNGSVAKFIDYLNMNSSYPISYRFSSGRHTDGFYANYVTPLFCSIHDLTYSNITKTNRVDSDCPITFTLRCEFNTIGMFDLSVPNPGEFVLRAPPPNSVMIPIFSDAFNEKDFPLLYGWKILSKPIIKLDWDEKEVDVSAALSETIIQMIRFHIEHNMNPELFINITLRENHNIIKDGYYVDWKRLMLVFTACNYTSTYRLIITLNQLYFNNLLIDMYNK